MGKTHYLMRILKRANIEDVLNYEVVVLNSDSDVMFTGLFICGVHDGQICKDHVRLSLKASFRESTAVEHGARPEELLHYKVPYNSTYEYYELLTTFDGYRPIPSEEMEIFKPFFLNVDKFYASHGHTEGRYDV